MPGRGVEMAERKAKVGNILGGSQEYDGGSETYLSKGDGNTLR